MKYAYPAIIRSDDDVYSVFFPDIGRGGTTGKDIPEALYMAGDWLTGTLYDLENDNEDPPKPSKTYELATEPGDFVTLVFADTIEYRKKYDSKSINKTLTIPNWLNSLAEEADINFSQTLQRALKNELKLQT